MKTSERKILKGYYWNHDAIRKDMERLKHVIEHFSNYSTSDFTQIANWFHYHEQCILYHHHGEDDYFFPIMKERVPQFRIELETMEHQHVQLDDNLEKLREIFLGLRKGTPGLQEAFMKAANDYTHGVINHLDQEENIVETLVASLPEEEVLKTETEYRKRIPRSEMATILPWIVDAMDDKDRDYFFGMTPFFVKWIYRWSAKPKFEKLTAF
jgi:hemerythrin-like domain-containing protein